MTDLLAGCPRVTASMSNGPTGIKISTLVMVDRQNRTWRLKTNQMFILLLRGLPSDIEIPHFTEKACFSQRLTRFGTDFGVG